MKNEGLGVKNEGINHYDRYTLRLQSTFPCPLDTLNIILHFFTLRIYKIGGEGGGRGSDCCRVEVHQGHRNPTHDKQVDDTNYSIDQLTNA